VYARFIASPFCTAQANRQVPVAPCNGILQQATAAVLTEACYMTIGQFGKHSMWIAFIHLKITVHEWTESSKLKKDTADVIS
jgi:hypothetical protein